MKVEPPTGHSAKVEAFYGKHRTGLVTLVFTDLVESVALRRQLGDQAGASLLQGHRELVRQALSRFPDAEEIETAGDSFLLLFARPSDAVKFALLVQRLVRGLARERDVRLADRIGIHVGEVVIEEHEHGHKPKDLYGSQIDLCARVMGLAEGGQILLTRGVFDSARQALKGEDIEGVKELSWLNHGLYLLKGIEEPVEVCEVGEAGIGVLKAPAGSEKAQRQVPPDAEPVLGWRPAIGQVVPNTQWVLQKKLGEGGFGEVWLGRHQKLKEWRVFKFCFRADKVRSLKREMTLFRVLKERVGDHPNIVRLLEVCFEEPPFYLVMDHVEGQDLKAWCEQQGGAEKVPLAVRLEIVAQIAEGLQAAHDAGVIHRDVKPSNILVSKPKSEGSASRNLNSRLTAKLTDFGIGQVVSEEALKGLTKAGFTQTLFADSSSSQTGSQMYMAPELLAGKPASIRSDIYSLGVVLYQLLAGDLTRPLTTDWASEIDDPLLRDDLKHCFAGNPQDRFAGAGQLAKNLGSLPERQAERLKQQAEIAAREKSAYRRGLLRAAAIGVVITIVIGGLALMAIRSESNAQRAAKEARSQRDKAAGLVYASQLNLAYNAYKDGKTGRAIVLLDGQRDGPDGKTEPAFEWRYLWRVCHSADKFTFPWQSNGLFSVAYSPDGRLLATGTGGGTIHLWDAGTRGPIGALPAHAGVVDSVAFHPNGKWLASASGKDGTVKLWDVASRELLHATNGAKGIFVRVAFSSDGQVFATGSADNKSTLLWNVIGTQLQARPVITLKATIGVLGPMAFSPDSRTLALCGGNPGRLDFVVRLYDMITGKLTSLPGHGAHVNLVQCAAFSPDGKTLATGAADELIILWDVETKREKKRLKGHEGAIWSVVFSRDSKMLASASWDETIKLWEVASGGEACSLKGHTARVLSLALSPDGETLASASPDGTTKLWDSNPGRLKQAAAEHQESAILGERPGRVFNLAVSRDGKLLAVSRGDVVELWNLGTKLKTGELKQPGADFTGVAFAPDGMRLASGTGNGPVILWDVAAQQLLEPSFEGHIFQSSHVGFGLDGKVLVSGGGGSDGTVKVWDIASRGVLTNFPAMVGLPVQSLAISPDGKSVAAGSADHTVRLWNLETLKQTGAFEGTVRFLTAPRFSPDGKLLVGADINGGVFLWEVTTRRLLRRFRGHSGGALLSMAFSPDGRTLATGSMDHTVKLWSLGIDQEVVTLTGHTGWVSSVVFSPDGNLLVTGSDDGSVRLWRAATFAEIRSAETDKAKEKLRWTQDFQVDPRIR